LNASLEVDLLPSPRRHRRGALNLTIRLNPLPTRHGDTASKDTISRIADEVVGEMAEWRKPAVGAGPSGDVHQLEAPEAVLEHFLAHVDRVGRA
jgi:hypothetical protein